MKVGLILVHPFSESPGSVVRVQELASSLGKQGVDVCILSPYESDGVIGENVYVKNVPGLTSALPGPSTYKLSRWMYNHGFFARRLFTSSTFWKRLQTRFAKGFRSVIANERIDLIQVEGCAEGLLASLKLKQELDIPFVADLHNIMSEELAAAGSIKKPSREFHVLQKMIVGALFQVDFTAVVSDEMKDYLVQECNLPEDKIAVVPPGGRVRVQGASEKNMPYKVVFAGLLSYREHVDLFVNSMPTILRSMPDVRFHLTRKGEELKRLMGMARNAGVKPEFFWFPNRNDLYDFLACCHVGVLSSTNDLARKMGTPVKLFDYMSLGLPVVANDIGAWTKIISEEKIGIVTEDNPESFAHGILNLLGDETMRNEYSSHAVELIKRRYNWDKSAKILVEAYKRL